MIPESVFMLKWSVAQLQTLPLLISLTLLSQTGLSFPRNKTINVNCPTLPDCALSYQPDFKFIVPPEPTFIEPN